MELYIDIAVILLAIIAIGIGIYFGNNLLEENRDDPKHSHSSSRELDIANEAHESSNNEFLGLRHSKITEIKNHNNREKKELHLGLVSHDMGFTYCDVIQASDSEMAVYYCRPKHSLNLAEVPYRKGDIITFALRGDDFEENTYHFKVRYKDAFQNSFVQEVVGKGKEVPQIHKPEPIQPKPKVKVKRVYS